MEYLPEKRRTQKAQVMKKEEKTRVFREYLANNDVVLSVVKCKCEPVQRSYRPKMRLTCRSSLSANRYLTVTSAIDILTVRGKEPWPADPLVHLRDYYGEERSPQWDLVDQLKEENARIVDELPEMEKKIEDLQKELKQLQLQNRALGVYTQSMDADKSNALGYKSIILKLSGFAKFDLDTKINKDQFH